MSDSALFTPLTLPNGAVLPNRICKAAMEENLAAPGQIPGADLFRLYKAWAEGGVGLVLTGNVMVSPAAMTGPGGVVLEAGTDLAPFREWARIGKPPGGHLWMQINHPGRQTMDALGEQAVAPSAIRVDLGQHSKLLAQPKALDEAEIRALINRYADTSAQAEAAGFNGVQIHAAHGYLISQFLSPLVNQRSDDWGGTRENRARFLLETVKAVRARVSPGFCVSVKLNSADFQKGGFDLEDAKWTAAQLNGLGIDLLELSGGSYESPAMQGHTDESSTSKREVYFIDFAREIASVAAISTTPWCVMAKAGSTRRCASSTTRCGCCGWPGWPRALPISASRPRPRRCSNGCPARKRTAEFAGKNPPWTSGHFGHFFEYDPGEEPLQPQTLHFHAFAYGNFGRSLAEALHDDLSTAVYIHTAGDIFGHGAEF